MAATVTSPVPSKPILHPHIHPNAYDTHDHDSPQHEPPYTTSLQQRQQQAAEFLRAQHNHSRASSSSGSAAHTLRRTPNLDEARRRYSSPPGLSTPQLPRRSVRFASPASGQNPVPDWATLEPHPALRISQRTASAIRFVLEEAVRLPYPFTPDLAEENASMSDLMGGNNGRAANGGARTAGPVPVTQSDRPNIVTPQMIMNNRRQREARRQQTEAEARAADEEQKAQDERIRSAERRVQAAGVADPTSNVDPGMQRQPQAQAPLESSYASYPPPGSATRQAERLNTAAPAAPQSRPRANSQSQQQPRAVQPPASATQASSSRRPPPVQHSRTPSAPAATTQPGASSAPAPQPPPPGLASSSQQRQSTTSTFPHAFERWETLSSHWEGLTSYWIRRLEQNTDDVRREPLAQQMSRQITDLSAAGANLFHAVVELQRLRASSERKFQRWFYDHRQEQERAREREAQLESALREERAARNQAMADMEQINTEKKNAERSLQEMRRELQISKEEARRAWEELGRREQEERDRTFSLREGQPTMVGGVQVLPTAQAMGRHGSVSHRSHGDESYGGGASDQGIDQHYSYEEGQSPTDTDPFTEGRHRVPLQPAPQATSYVPSGAGPSSLHQSGLPPAAEPTKAPVAHYSQQASSSHRATGGASERLGEPTTSQPEAFYQQPEAYLHRDTTGAAEDERSAITSHGDETSEGEEEYAIDDHGNYILDASGHRVPFRALRQQDSDEYDVQEDRRREIEHLQRYGSAAADPSGYATASSAGSSHQGGYQTTSTPDYSGSGYGSEWVAMRSHHHHPTRLSDVMEEDERSRTSPSRASQASRGWA